MELHVGELGVVKRVGLFVLAISRPRAEAFLLRRRRGQAEVPMGLRNVEVVVEPQNVRLHDQRAARVREELDEPRPIASVGIDPGRH